MNMSVARALTEKARLTQKIQEARNVVSRWNAVELGTRRPLSVTEALQELSVLGENLLRVKTALNAANVGIARQLAELMYVRGEIAFYEGLDTSEERRTLNNDGEEIKTTNDLALNFIDVRTKVKELKVRLDALQDEVDEYNATHRLDIELI